MKPWSIRWLLLGVSAAVIVLPALSLITLRWYTGYLVRRTEEQLLGQGVLVAEAFRAAWSRRAHPERSAEAPELPARGRYAPIELLAEHLSELTPNEPVELPRSRPEQRESIAYHAGRELEPLLKRAQVHTLSAVRVLDVEGCVVATTLGDADRCLRGLPEVERALGGRYAAVLRARVSDEPPPALSSLSRRGDQRVFIALPIVEEGRTIAVVRLSRTAESGLEWIWKNRLSFLGGVALIVTAALVLSFVCASLIARPLERMARAATGVASYGIAWPAASVGWAPRELTVLGEALGTMTNKLGARARYVSEFAANASHELKAPLTSIRGAAELLRDDWSSMPAAQRDRFLENIQADVERMEALVLGLLHLARIENPELGASAHAVDFARIGSDLELRYPEHVRVTITDPDARIDVPAEHLASALGNLVDNALRYRRERPVEVRLSERTGRLHVEVEDDGPGISPANRARIFERFFTTERDRGGSGLGLAIVRAIAEARGGSVAFDSSSSGTVFRLEL